MVNGTKTDQILLNQIVIMKMLEHINNKQDMEKELLDAAKKCINSSIDMIENS